MPPGLKLRTNNERRACEKGWKPKKRVKVANRLVAVDVRGRTARQHLNMVLQREGRNISTNGRRR